MAQEKIYTEDELKKEVETRVKAVKKGIYSKLQKAFEAGAKTESIYVGGGNSKEEKVYPTFDHYAKVAKIKKEEA